MKPTRVLLLILIGAGCSPGDPCRNNTGISFSIDLAVLDQGLKAIVLSGPCAVSFNTCPTDDNLAFSDTGFGCGFGIGATDVGVCTVTILLLDDTVALSRSFEFGFPQDCCADYEPCPLIPYEERNIRVSL